MFDTKLLAKLDSATKYPSIPTFHELGDRGILQESGNPFAGYQGPIVATEKVDGTNARIIIDSSSDWIIGSRDRLLTAAGDRVYDDSYGIVDKLRDLVPQLWIPGPSELFAYFFEVYGQRESKNHRIYSDGKEHGARLFDVATIPTKMFNMSVGDIAQWRDNDGQEFWPIHVHPWALDRVPRLATYANGDELPDTVEGMQHLINQLAGKTQVAINEGADDARRAEGVVFRTAVHRHKIFKARHESYTRTMTERSKANA